MEVCENPDILRVIFFGKELINIVKIVVPIALIILGMVDFTKALASNDDKANKKNIILFFKRVLNAVLIFAVPWIVEFVIVTLGDLAKGVNFTDCLQNANADKIAELDAIVAEQDKNNHSNNSNSNNSNDSNSGSNNKDYTILVGDSRVVGMCNYVKVNSNTDCSIAEVSKEASWFKNTAYSKIKEKLSSNPNSYVVIYMGTNDLGTIDDSTSIYAEYENKLANEYPNAKVVVVSVTPIIDGKVKNYKDIVNDASAVKFNNTLSTKLNSNVLYCDIHDKKLGYSAKDGIHYNKNTYKKIYNSILECLK